MVHHAKKDDDGNVAAQQLLAIMQASPSTSSKHRTLVMGSDCASIAYIVVPTSAPPTIFIYSSVDCLLYHRPMICSVWHRSALDLDVLPLFFLQDLDGQHRGAAHRRLLQHFVASVDHGAEV